MADYKVTDTELISIANAIRTKGGTQAQLEFPTGFVSAVQAIPTGGGANLQEKTATVNGTVLPDQGYDGLSKVYVAVQGGGGATILTGATDPQSNVGTNGDLYFLVPEISKIYSANSVGYIDLGFGGGDYDVEIIFSFDAPVSSYSRGDAWVFGNYANSRATMIGISASGQIYVAVNNNISEVSFDNYIHTVKYTTHGVYCDGSLLNLGSISGALTSNFFAFATNAGSAAGRIPHSSIYEINVYEYDTETLVKKYIPSNANGEAQLYETISGTYFVSNPRNAFHVEEASIVLKTYAKVDGVWQPLIGTSINDIDLGGN